MACILPTVYMGDCDGGVVGESEVRIRTYQRGIYTPAVCRNPSTSTPRLRFPKPIDVYATCRPQRHRSGSLTLTVPVSDTIDAGTASSTLLLHNVTGPPRNPSPLLEPATFNQLPLTSYL
jgi:hypothetical protein